MRCITNGIVVKFFKSPIWADRLIALGEGLASRKQDIEFALSVHTVAGVDATWAAVDQLNLKINKLIAIVERRSRREQDLESMIEELGGRALVMDDPNNLELAEKIVQRAELQNREMPGARARGLKEANLRTVLAKKPSNRSGPTSLG